MKCRTCPNYLSSVLLSKILWFPASLKHLASLYASIQLAMYSSFREDGPLREAIYASCIIN